MQETGSVLRLENYIFITLGVFRFAFTRLANTKEAIVVNFMGNKLGVVVADSSSTYNLSCNRSSGVKIFCLPWEKFCFEINEHCCNNITNKNKLIKKMQKTYIS